MRVVYRNLQSCYCSRFSTVAKKSAYIFSLLAICLFSIHFTFVQVNNAGGAAGAGDADADADVPAEKSTTTSSGSWHFSRKQVGTRLNGEGQIQQYRHYRNVSLVHGDHANNSTTVNIITPHNATTTTNKSDAPRRPPPAEAGNHANDTMNDYNHTLLDDSGGLGRQEQIMKRHQCIQYVSTQKLPSLITKLLQDPETNGLKPLVFRSSTGDGSSSTPRGWGDNDEFLQGLELNTFRKRRIALMGDSTLYFMTKHVYTMLLDKHGRSIIPRQDPGFSNMTLSRGKEYVEANARGLGVALGCCQDPRPIDIPQDGTHIEWMGISGPSQDRMKERLDAMFTRAEEIQPEIIVANMALHWVHLCGHARCPLDGFVVNLWLNYKRDWLEKVYDFALKVNAKLLLFKTANFVCDDAKTDYWATYSSLYLAQDSAVLEETEKAYLLRYPRA